MRTNIVQPAFGAGGKLAPPAPAMPAKKEEPKPAPKKNVFCRFAGNRYCCQTRELGEFHVREKEDRDNYILAVENLSSEFHKASYVSWGVTNCSQEKIFRENGLDLHQILVDAGFRPVYEWKSPNTNRYDIMWVRGIETGGEPDDGFKKAAARFAALKNG